MNFSFCDAAAEIGKRKNSGRKKCAVPNSGTSGLILSFSKYFPPSRTVFKGNKIKATILL